MDINEKYKSWDTIKYEHNLADEEKLQWLQLVYARLKLWVEALNKDLGLSLNRPIYDHNLNKNCQLHALDELVSKDLYNISLCSMYEISTSQSCYEKLLGKKFWTGKKYTLY